jgi:superfamily I DNA/RNA helicase
MPTNTVHVWLQTLRGQNLVDFDDCLVLSKWLLGLPEVREREQERWRHVLVDEVRRE